MITLYYKAESPLHRLSAGSKLLFLLLLGTLLFTFENIWMSGGVLAVVVGLFVAAHIPLRHLFYQLKPVLIFLVIIFVIQVVFNGWAFATLIVIRFTALILAASLVTMTTMTSHMMAAIERFLTPFDRWIPVEKISLAMSLAIRFIPIIATVTHEVREAQRVRGLDKNIFAIAMPVVIRTLKMGDQIAEALDARSFDTDPGD